jgi:hypothetical protein
LLLKVIANHAQSSRALCLGAVLNLFDVILVESGIDMFHHKGTELSILLRKVRQSRQSIPVVHQITSKRLAVALSNASQLRSVTPSSSAARASASVHGRFCAYPVSAKNRMTIKPMVTAVLFFAPVMRIVPLVKRFHEYKTSRDYLRPKMRLSFGIRFHF